MIQTHSMRRLTDEQRQTLQSKDNIVHWTSGNLIVMFMGKCANTAIKAAILAADGGIDPEYNVHADPRLNYVNRKYAIKFRRTVPVVAIVRRPWDRIISFWRDKIQGRTEENFTAGYLPGAYAGMPLEAFVRLVVDLSDGDNYLGDIAPAYSYLCSHGLAIPRDTIKFEDLINGPGWDRLRLWSSRAWDLPVNLPLVNAARSPMPQLTAADEERLRIQVYMRYREDYKRFEWRA
jgi:Sulfotransferase family